MLYDPADKRSYEEEIELTKALLDFCEGRWDWVLQSALPELAPVIEAGHQRHARCIFPHHGGANDMRITRDFARTGSVICTCTAGNPVKGGLDVVMRARGVDFKTARNYLLEVAGVYLNTARTTVVPPPAPVRATPSEDELKHKASKVKERIKGIWNHTIALDHPEAEPARRWFASRGLWPFEDMGEQLLTTVRFHRHLAATSDGTLAGHFPAIVSMMTDSNNHTTTLHRTYITPEGGKPVQLQSATRKLYTVPCDRTASGSAIKLDRPGPFLNVAEGLETALSVRAMTRMPTWSCFSKDVLASLVIPPCVKYLTVWADKDRSNAGQTAALEVYKRNLSGGVKMIGMLPPGDIPVDAKSLDWNDLHRSLGLEGMRKEWHVRQWFRAVERIIARDGAQPSQHAGQSASV